MEDTKMTNNTTTQVITTYTGYLPSILQVLATARVSIAGPPKGGFAMFNWQSYRGKR